MCARALIGASISISYLSAGPPVFTSPLKDGFVQVGKKAVLECKVEGVPSPVITWSKDGRTLKSTDLITVDNTQLSMEPVSVWMAGRYKCEASNKLGSAVTYANVSVIGENLSQHDTSLIVRIDSVNLIDRWIH